MSDSNTEVNSTVIDETNEETFILIFKDDKHNVLAVEKTELNEIMDIIQHFQMPEKSYFLIKGKRII